MQQRGNYYLTDISLGNYRRGVLLVSTEPAGRELLGLDLHTRNREGIRSTHSCR
jgi:hypothetical protein